MKLTEVSPVTFGKAPESGSIFRGVTLQSGTDKHTHPFEIRYDRNGKILGGKALRGETDHTHDISSPKRTQSSQGHSHPLPIPAGGAVATGAVSGGSGNGGGNGGGGE